jgi:Na+/H+ antiporter NhaD/arsenite permease-like protein
MLRRAGTVGALAILLWPGLASAAGPRLRDVAAWSAMPFVGLLLCIAILPLAAEHFWHSNGNRALVAFGFAIPVVIYLVYLEVAHQQPGLVALGEALHEYAAFIILLGALYTVAGGLMVELQARPTPANNAALLALGAVLANLIGTTGASMVLIRPYLRINKARKFTHHLPIFFIFLVSNLGGLLTPLGDPPLFLGFLRGVDFFWTMRLWPEWLAANGIVLAIFFAWDARAFAREPDRQSILAVSPSLSVRGLSNVLLLAGIIAAVLTRSLADGVAEALGWSHFLAEALLGELPMLLMAVLSLCLTPRGLRKENGFSWGAIIEVAVLFIGIFITMVPPLELLEIHGDKLGLSEPWQFFWLTGTLSAFLDNAPTYLTFATMAAGENELGWLMTNKPFVLAAISCGAVFMGAMTYIGNGPNFMVKAICAEAGYATPSFFGFLAYSALILVPTFALVMLLPLPNLSWW